MNHSPGPWKVEGEEDSVSYPAVVAADDTEVCLFCGDTDRPTRYANARLIAAAPDLLEAALEALTDLALVLATAEHSSVCRCPKCVTAAKLLAAVRKAKGEES